MDVDRHTVAVDGAEIAMPLKEFELLELLLRNAGRVLTRGQLIDRVWGSDYFGDTKTLDVHIKRIRSRIEENPSRADACSSPCAGSATASRTLSRRTHCDGRRRGRAGRRCRRAAVCGSAAGRMRRGRREASSTRAAAVEHGNLS